MRLQTALLVTLAGVILSGPAESLCGADAAPSAAPAPIPATPSEKRATGNGGMELSVVKITTTAQAPNYKTPWSPGDVNRGVGAGFVIEGGRVMTNAHVVSNATFVAVEKEGDPRPYVAVPEFIAHDSDLAVLRIEDERFARGAVPLKFGEVPAVESVVQAYGYPVGGDRYSVTRGVVSRVDFQTYSHSGVDAHLVVQIDAAINPGNSGGPVMQDGLVVGVAFQGYSGDVAQNVGYIIPVPVIRRFLKDIEDGSYDGYVDLAILYLNLVNPTQRRALGLEDDGRGVMVGEVFAEGSADGHLRPGDILLSVDGLPIFADGYIEIGGSLVEMPEVAERKQLGDPVRFELLRDGNPLSVTFPLRGIWPMSMQANQYERELSYLLYGGLLFQPLSRGLVEAYGGRDLRLRYFYERFLVDELYAERPEVIVLSAVLPDTTNTYLTRFAGAVVDKVNGNPVRTMQELADAIDSAGETVVIEALSDLPPIVLESRAVEDAHQRILDSYGVSRERNILPPPNAE